MNFDLLYNVSKSALTGGSHKAIASFNITNRCPLSCAGCYSYDDKGQPTQGEYELSDQEVVAKMKELSRSGIRLMVFVGGEPMLRFNLISKIVELKIFDYHWVVTSGIYPLKPVEKTLYFVSIDGTRRAHDMCRPLKGGSGTYEKAIGNIGSVTRLNQVVVHMTVRAGNECEIEKLAHEIFPDVNGMIVSTMTPEVVVGGVPIAVAGSQIDYAAVVDYLLSVKNAYGRWLKMTKRDILALKTGHMESQSSESCRLATHVVSFRSDGSAIDRCIFGPAADCTHCGCAAKNLIHNIDLSKVSLLVDLWRLRRPRRGIRPD